MNIDLSPGENLTIKLGTRGTIVVHWIEDINLNLTDDCRISVFRQPNVSLSHEEVKTMITPEGYMEIKLERGAIAHDT
jgi:hypothetical protein